MRRRESDFRRIAPAFPDDTIACTETQSRRPPRWPRDWIGFTLTEFSQNLPRALAPAAAAPPIRVILVISSKLERLGWSIVVEGQADMELLGQFGSLGEALRFLSAHRVDVALIDEAMLTPRHCDALRRHAAQRLSRFLLVARHPVDETWETSRYSFASGCLLKGITAGSLLAAIRGDGVHRD
jgi:hypothetical protein